MALVDIARKWSSLCVVEPTDKSSFPEVNNIYVPQKGVFVIFVLEPLIDNLVSSMLLTLVEKFMSPNTKY